MGTNGDKFRLKKVSFRLPSELVEEYEMKANRFEMPLSHILRDQFLQGSSATDPTSDPSAQILQAIQNIGQKLTELQLSPATETNSSAQDNPLCLEILFLLREFLFERNAQVLKKVDEKMEKRFGKDRKRIL